MPHELPKLVKAVDQEPNIYIRSAIWLLLLTGLRKMELLSAKWEDVMWERGQLRLPNTKSGEEQFASLSAAAMAILQSIPKREGNPYIIPGAWRGQHLKRIDPAWSRITSAAGVQDLQIHDLRRTAGSWMTQAGVDLNTIKDALRQGHSVQNRNVGVNSMGEQRQSKGIYDKIGRWDRRRTNPDPKEIELLKVRR